MSLHDNRTRHLQREGEREKVDRTTNSAGRSFYYLRALLWHKSDARCVYTSKARSASPPGNSRRFINPLRTQPGAGRGNPFRGEIHSARFLETMTKCSGNLAAEH